MIGKIEVICGSMFSGKSEELLRRLRRAKFAGQSYVLCKPVQDTRTNGGIATHSGTEAEALSILSGYQLHSIENLEALDIIAIDEAQFLDHASVNVVENLAANGKRIIIAGLDLDYRGEPFGPMPHFMAIAEKVTKLQAVCMSCGADACRTQRLEGGSEKLVEIGAADKYEARCRACFKPPITESGRTQWSLK